MTFAARSRSQMQPAQQIDPVTQNMAPCAYSLLALTHRDLSSNTTIRSSDAGNVIEAAL